jgi:hypothetical protein
MPSEQLLMFARLVPLVVVLLAAPTAAAADEPRRVFGVLAGGVGHGQLLDVDVTTPSFEGGVSVALHERVAMTLAATVDIGETKIGGLGLGEVAPFATFELVLWRFRLGAGPQLSYFWIDRAGDRPAIDALGLGLRGRISFDLVYLDDAPKAFGTRTGIYLAASPSAEWLTDTNDLFTGGAAAWRANATLGLRF